MVVQEAVSLAVHMVVSLAVHMVVSLAAYMNMNLIVHMLGPSRSSQKWQKLQEVAGAPRSGRSSIK